MSLMRVKDQAQVLMLKNERGKSNGFIFFVVIDVMNIMTIHLLVVFNAF